MARRRRFEDRHRAIGGNALQAAVLGANDGLVSNFRLVMGVAGASAGGGPMLIAPLCLSRVWDQAWIASSVIRRARMRQMMRVSRASCSTG